LVLKSSGWVSRKPFELLRQSESKARRFCPCQSKAARFKASLSSPNGEEPCPLSLSHGFLITLPSLGNAKPACFQDIQPELPLFLIFHLEKIILLGERK
jgi:hypothetical protein